MREKQYGEEPQNRLLPAFNDGDCKNADNERGAQRSSPFFFCVIEQPQKFLKEVEREVTSRKKLPPCRMDTLASMYGQDSLP